MSIGKIVTWQDDKGFGFLKSEDFSEKIFVHISSFASGSPRPKIGDEVVFFVKETPKGKQAYNVRPKDYILKNKPANKKHYKTSSTSVGRKYKPIFSLIMLSIIGLVVFKFSDSHKGINDSYKGPNYATSIVDNTYDKVQNTPKEAKTSKKYTCDGREYCSQMTTKEEAEWFSKNCPNTKMDGDNDGDVCESDSRWRRSR